MDHGDSNPDENSAWELLELPPGRNLVSCKWGFKPKHDANGNIVRFKARLGARGFSQTYGIDCFETYAPVAKLTTYRVIFALAALEQWEIHGMDVITAYLLGILDEEIYMVQPEGFVRTGMKIMRNPEGGISIDQSGHIRQIIERMSNSKLVLTPLAPGVRLAKATEAGHGNVDL